MASNSEVVTIDELISDLREQLTKAVKARPPSRGIYFQLGEVQLELQVALKRNTSGTAKFSLQVLGLGGVEAGGGAGREVARGHTFRLKLEPWVTKEDGSYRRVLLSDEVDVEDVATPMAGRAPAPMRTAESTSLADEDDLEG